MSLRIAALIGLLLPLAAAHAEECRKIVKHDGVAYVIDTCDGPAILVHDANFGWSGADTR